MNLTNLFRVAATSVTPEMEEALDGVYGGHLVGNDSLAERAAFGLEVMLIGMGVVFGVLLLLIGILQVFKLFVKEQSKPAETKEVASAPVTAAPAVVAPTVAAPASEEEAIVAIASSAIAAHRGESDCAFKILSIKKIVK